MRPPCLRCIRAFSLVEVLVALGIATFALIGVMGLINTGLHENQESENRIQAADLASLIVFSRQGSASSSTGNMTNFALPATALTNAYASVYVGQYIGLDGAITNAANAAYRISCSAGTNSMTGPNVSQVYLRLTWPPQSATGSDRYEVTTYVPIP